MTETEATYPKENTDSETNGTLHEESKESVEVNFGVVRVHTHDIVLGDNPSVSQGPPLTLDWDANKSECYSLDEFEKINNSGGHHAKRVSMRTREIWLREMGHSTESFNRVSDEIEHIKTSRQLSRNEEELALDEGYVLVRRTRSRSPHSSNDRLWKKRLHRRRHSCDRKVPTTFLGLTAVLLKKLSPRSLWASCHNKMKGQGTQILAEKGSTDSIHATEGSFPLF